MSLQRMHRRASITIPYPRRIITTPADHSRRRSRRELCGQDGLAVAGDRGRTSRDGLDSENSLRRRRDVLHLFGADEAGLEEGLVDVGGEGGGDEVCRCFAIGDWEGEAVRDML